MVPLIDKIEETIIFIVILGIAGLAALDVHSCESL